MAIRQESSQPLIGLYVVLPLPDLEHGRFNIKRYRCNQSYHCHDCGHYSTQCPNRLMSFSNKKPIEKEVHILQQSIILEVEKVSERDASKLEDDQPIYVLCPLLTTQEENKEDWQEQYLSKSSLLQLSIVFYGY